MAIFLNNLEHYYDETLLILAENILSNKLLTHFVKHDMGVYSADIQTYEVEIQLKAEKIVASSCDCKSQQEHCAHEVALAMYLRKFLIQQKIDKNTKKQQSAVSSRLNISTILRDLDSDDLKEFIREYARKDKKFSTTFKSVFIHKTAVLDDNKYHNYLRSILPSKDYKNPSLNNCRTIQKVYNKLIEGADENFIQGDFLEPWQCVQAILEYHYPIILKDNVLKLGFEQQLKTLIQLLGKIYAHTNAYELKQKIEAFVFTEVQKFNYRNNSNAINYFLQILQKFKTSYDEGVEEVCKNGILSSSNPISYHATTFAIYIQLMYQWKQKTALKKWLQGQYFSPVLILKTAEILLLQQKGKTAEWFLNHTIHANYSKRDYLALLEGTQAFYLEIKQYESAIKYGLKAFEIKPKVMHFESLVEPDQSLISKEVFEAFEQILIQAHETGNHELALIKAQLLICSDQIEGLCDYLKEINDIDVYLNVLDGIPKAYANNHKDLLIYIIDSYLNAHFGDKPVKKLRQLIQALNYANEVDLINHLELHIKEKFVSRKNLMEEILY